MLVSVALVAVVSARGEAWWRQALMSLLTRATSAPCDGMIACECVCFVPGCSWLSSDAAQWCLVKVWKVREFTRCASRDGVTFRRPRPKGPFCKAHFVL